MWKAGTISLVSSNVTALTTGANDASTDPAISPDGKHVAFVSEATDLFTGFVDGNTAAESDVFLRDVAAKTTRLVSAKVGTPNTGSAGTSTDPAVSIDGGLVVFSSTTGADLLTSFTDANAASTDVFLRDVEANATALVSQKTTSASTGGGSDSFHPSISGDGRFVAFASMATDIVAPAPTNTFTNVFVRDRNLATTTMVNLGTTGAESNGNIDSLINQSGPVLSLDGRNIAYASGATNLVASDLNTAFDVFLTVLRSPGYWLDASDGGIFTYSSSLLPAPFFGSAGATKLNQPIVGMTSTPTGKGYWLVASDGGVFNYGDAVLHGSAGALTLNKPIVGMASTPTGKGYWLVASDGGIFAYGDAVFYGSTGALTLNKPIVGMASTPTGKGYWLVASDGGIFAYGDAVFYGSTGALTLNKPIVGMASTPTGSGYWLVASDGGIFAYGDGAFLGSMGATKLNKPIVGMATNTDGLGYWLVASDGGIFAYGTAGFYGSTGALTLNKPIVGMAIR